MDSVSYFRALLGPEEFDALRRYETIPEMLQNAVAQFAALPALEWPAAEAIPSGEKSCFGEKSFFGEKSYFSLDNDVAAARGFLCGQNLPAGAHVGLLCKNDYDFVRLFLAVTSAGFVAVLFPEQTPQAALPAMVQAYDVALLLHSESLAASVSGLSVPCIPAASAIASPCPAACGLTKDTPAAILFSGGTTGRPKGALLSHGALLRGAYNGAMGYEKTFFQRYVSLIPFTHVFGLVRCLLTGLLTGSLVGLCPERQAMLASFARVKPTVLVLVPALADLLFKLAAARGPGALGGALKVVIAGGAAVPPRLIAAGRALGVHVLPGYGLTETANLVSGNGEPDAYPDSVGMPYPEQTLKIVDGELLVKGDHLMLCYYGDPAATAAAMEDGFLHTGDLARFDEDGRLYIVGRKKNLIVRGDGENVSPEALEQLVCALPGVQDCLVTAVPNEFGQDMLQVEILPLPGADAAGLPAAVAALNETLPPYMRMQKTLLRTADFPRSPSMKILRPGQGGA